MKALLITERFILACGFCGSLAGLMSCAAESEGDTKSVRSISSDQSAQPAVSWEAYKLAATRSVDGRDVYVVEWDLAVTEQELRQRYEAYVEAVSPGSTPQKRTESIVNRVNNEDDVWPNNGQMSLTYCVSNTFGTNKARAVSEMAQATAAWLHSTNATFAYDSSQDANCTGANTSVSFAVAPWTSSGACSFFPSGSACVARTLVINFSDLDTNPYYQTHAPDVRTVGVFRHELGHILGLRHEHTRPESGVCFEDNNWRELTAYDQGSVMHYPWCNGVLHSTLDITPLDTLGVRLLYGGDLASPANSPAAYVREDAVNAALYRDGGGDIHELTLTAGGWSSADLSAITGAPAAASDPSAYIRADRMTTVVYRGTDAHIRELSLSNGGWSVGDLSAITGAPDGTGGPSGYRRSDGTSSVVYRSTDNHIRELYLSPGSGWLSGDLSAIAGAPDAASDPLGYVRADRVNTVVYRGTDNHVYELSLAGGSWIVNDLSAITGAPAAAGNLAAYVRSDATSSVLYRGTDDHVYELYLPPDSGWNVGDLSAITGAPAAASDPTAYARGDSINTVLYRGTDDHIYELSLSGGWNVGDLSAITGAPTATDRPAGYLRSDGINAVVYKNAGNGHIQELSLSSAGGGWSIGDLGI